MKICFDVCFVKQNLVREIDSSDNLYSAESATSNLFSLTQEGAHLCRIIAKVKLHFDLVVKKLPRIFVGM